MEDQAILRKSSIHNESTSGHPSNSNRAGSTGGDLSGEEPDANIGTVLAEVRNLSTEFRGLREEFRGLKDEFSGLKTEFRGMKEEMAGLKTAVVTLTTDVNLRFAALEAKVNEVKTEVAKLGESLRAEISKNTATLTSIDSSIKQLVAFMTKDRN